MTSTISISANQSFLRSIVQVREYRNYLFLGLGISIVSFILFKLLYPYPDFFSDSYSYLEAAYFNLSVSIWPIGYSKFLWAFHQLTHSDTAFVAFTYFFLQISALYFFFSVLYLYHPSKTTQKLLFVFLFINPLSLYLSNTINSDALFGAMSLLWVTQLLWILHRPRMYQLFVQAILLFLCFTVRNNAYYYPLIAIIAFLLTKQNWKWKLAGMVLPFLLIIPFVIHTQNEAYKITGTRQFSLFTGWQLANNALYIYDQIKVDTSIFHSQEAKSLNELSLNYFRHINKTEYRDILETYVGNFFIKQPNAPLKKYFVAQYKPKDELGSIEAWGQASSIFESFGKPIIVNYPFSYLRYFVFPNATNYFIPPLSHLGLYNYGQNKIGPIAQYWFNYSGNKIYLAVSPGLQGKLLTVYVYLFAFINLYYLLNFILYTLKYIYFKTSQKSNNLIWLISIFLLLNFGFSIIATINIMRYQYVPMILLFTFVFVLNDMLAELKHLKPRWKSKSLLSKKIQPTAL